MYICSSSAAGGPRKRGEEMRAKVHAARVSAGMEGHRASSSSVGGKHTSRKAWPCSQSKLALHAHGHAVLCARQRGMIRLLMRTPRSHDLRLTGEIAKARARDAQQPPPAPDRVVTQASCSPRFLLESRARMRLVILAGIGSRSVCMHIAALLP